MTAQTTAPPVGSGSVALVGRPYVGMDDLARMHALLRVGRRLADATTDLHPGDLEWWIGMGDPAIDWSERVTLWSLGGDPEPIAWTWWTPPDELDWFVDQTVDGPAIRAALLDRLGRPLLTVWTPDHAAPLIEMLEMRGFTRGTTGYAHHARGLDPMDDPPLRLPDGFTVRSVRLPDDLDERVRVHRAAFAPSRYTTEKHRRVASMPLYRPELDLVAQAPDGTFASFAICWFDEETGTAEFEPVGTDPAFQRRGLATAVMTEALRRVARLGAGVAFVSSSLTRPGGTELYRSMGFREVRRTVAYVPVNGESRDA